MTKRESYSIHVAYSSPDEYENLLDNDFDIQEYTIRDNCLVLTLWNDDEITVPMSHILFFIVQE